MLAATLYQVSHDMNHTIQNIESTERYTLHVQMLFE